MTYEIKDLSLLESDTADLSSANGKIQGNASSLQYIINQIRANWQNEAGQDLASILQELEECSNTLTNAIVPTVEKYVNTMNTLAAESRRTQGNTL